MLHLYRTTRRSSMSTFPSNTWTRACIKTPASVKEGQVIASAFRTISSFCAVLASVLMSASDLV